MKNPRIIAIGLALLGLAGATLLVAWFGAGQIKTAILSVGWGGFALFILAQLATMVLLGIAWWAILPPGRHNLAILVGGRMVRDAAGACLPFSQIGGFVLGARAAMLGGLESEMATISTVIDLTAEFVAEIMFLIIGLIILLAHTRDSSLTHPLEWGLFASLLAACLGLWSQPRSAALFVRQGRKLMGRWLKNDDPMSDGELEALYGNKARLALGTLLHLLGWMAKGFGNWLAFRLLGEPIDLLTAFAIEGLLHGMLAVAIMVPGYAGVQEAGYIALGSLFGLSAELSLSVSLLRRARDLAIGLPILLTWQWAEMHHLPGSARKS